MHRLQPLAFSLALLLFLPGLLSVIAGVLQFRTEHILSGLLGISAGALLLTYGGWLALRGARQRFPTWISDLHTIFHI